MLTVVFLLCIAGALCAPAVDEPVAIISKEIAVEPDGKFHFSYETGDGIKAQEQGEVKVLDKDHAIETVQGNYEYTAPNGEKVAVQYTADEHGFHPISDSLPEGLQKALKYLEEHPGAEE